MDEKIERNKNVKVISQKQRIIILYSETVNSFPKLKALLDKHKSISQQMVENCIDMDKETQKLLKLKKSVFEIYQSAFLEWEAENNYDEGNKICSLCNRYNRRIFYIKNQKNGIRLNVGSECVKHFEGIKNENGIDIIQLPKRIEREKIFANYINNFDKRILHYEYKLSNSPYLVEFSSYNSAVKTIKDIKKIRSEYIDGKRTRTCFNDISELFKKIDIIFDKINFHNHELKGNNFACSKEIVRWIEQTKKEKIKEEIIRRIRINNSIIGQNTINEISYLPFVKAHLDEYKKVLKETFIDIRIDNQGGITRLYFNTHNRRADRNNIEYITIDEITFCCTPETFMKQLGNILFFNYNENKCKQKLSSEFLFTKVLSLHYEENNIYIFYKKLNIIFSDEFEFIYDFKLKQTYIINNKLVSYHIYSGVSKVVKETLRYIDSDNYKELCNKCYFGQLKWSKLTDIRKQEIDKIRNEFNDNMLSIFY